ncbi:MAG: peptide chain release factor 3, partial [Hyphomicrobiaceae bacterium]
MNRRRTFAIISHPDAGKTTLTEKLLLFGGAIQLAGQVKAKKDKQSTRSDWMAIEKARGISVATSVMTFEYGGHVFNLLDTPGHEDFSDHTYRTLTAVDSAIMVIDAARGIEARTLKLFEICRLRDIPIITFVNKMDREARSPLEALDEIEKMLALDTAPLVWPIGSGRDFKGVYDMAAGRLRRLDQEGDGTPVESGDDPVFDDLLEPDQLATWREEVELVGETARSFDVEAFRQGTLTPVFFGSALKNFGVKSLLEALIAYAPPPRSQKAAHRLIEAVEPRMTGVVFKIQANMDKNHRDRIAFMRVCSGKLSRGMKAKIVRSGRVFALQSPQFFFAQDRSLAEEAYAGDVVGIPNKGLLRIGDA